MTPKNLQELPSQRSSIREDIKLLHDNKVDTLTSLNVKNWVSERNCVVRSFLNGIAGSSKDYVEENPRTNLLLAKTIEQIYHVQNKNTVLPFSLSENLVVHAATRSKAACNVTLLPRQLQQEATPTSRIG